MKSSSELFPVRLLRADSIGDLNDDVYLVKHNLAHDKSVEIALTRVSTADHSSYNGDPIIMVHGSFSNRGFWLSNKGVGLARYLVEQGFDVWLFEQRGHGLSPRNQNYQQNTLEDYVLYDVAAIQAFVEEQTQKKPSWVGHSLGGVMIATAVAAKVLNAENTRKLVLFGSQTGRRPWYLWIPLVGGLVQAFTHLKGEIDGRKIGIGPEYEPAGIIQEYVQWNGLFGRWYLKSTRQYLVEAWQSATIPLLSVAAKADKSDPASACHRFFKQYAQNVNAEQSLSNEYKLLSQDNGFSKDYGHVDMVVSKEAAREVWPKISQWLKE